MVHISHRINTLLLVLLVVMAGAIISMLATRAYGGPLDPPGPPASTAGGIDGRIPIDHLPFATTAGGSYVVTKNLSAAASQSGITVCCSNTTVDLGGFTLFGAGAGMSPGDGIYNAGARNVVVRNGAVRGWNNGINLAGTYSRVEGVYATSNLNDGIVVGAGSVVSDCTASLNGRYGIAVNYATVRNCIAMENSIQGINVGSGSLVEDNRVNANTPGYGIYLVGDNATVRNNELSSNNNIDIDVSAGTGNVVTGNAYCTLFNAGTNTVITGNIDRVNC